MKKENEENNDEANSASARRAALNKRLEELGARNITDQKTGQIAITWLPIKNTGKRPSENSESREKDFIKNSHLTTFEKALAMMRIKKLNEMLAKRKKPPAPPAKEMSEKEKMLTRKLLSRMGIMINAKKKEE